MKSCEAEERVSFGNKEEGERPVLSNGSEDVNVDSSLGDSAL
jgi:hypothetical protein